MPDALAKCTHCGFVHSVLHCDVGEGQAYDMARRIYADTLPQVLVDSDVPDAEHWVHDFPEDIARPRFDFVGACMSEYAEILRTNAGKQTTSVVVTGGGGAGGGPWGCSGGGGSHPTPQAKPVVPEPDHGDDTSPFEIDFKRAQAYFLAQKFSW
jgi:hypothetical protein